MRRWSFATGVLLWTAVAGCGPNELPYTDNSQDPKAYARDMRQMVLNNVRQAKHAPEPVEYLRPLLSELKQADRPHGDLAPLYRKMLGEVELLIKSWEAKGAKTDEFTKGLDALAALAKTIPES